MPELQDDCDKTNAMKIAYLEQSMPGAANRRNETTENFGANRRDDEKRKKKRNLAVRPMACGALPIRCVLQAHSSLGCTFLSQRAFFENATFNDFRGVL
ncbi:hypothetical protein TWF730_002759 [Orbilia blumenaviensis]|uniref:Uncharacterized protein n=1 Tax=Orbilia blumenaviensis TaxID=1796055 RepID=A0AAV9UA13_9PEZI